MYNNIGRKIKGMAKVIFAILAFFFILMGTSLLNAGADAIEGLGVILIVLGPVFAWVSSFLLYGFGELVEKVCNIERNICGDDKKVKKVEGGSKQGVTLSLSSLIEHLS